MFIRFSYMYLDNNQKLHGALTTFMVCLVYRVPSTTPPPPPPPHPHPKKKKKKKEKRKKKEDPLHGNLKS